MSSAPPESKKTIADLLSIMEALRDPQTGCPWDVKQTFGSIAPYTIEEAYEVADAIQRDDFDDLKEELGDLLLQVVYHSQMAREDGHFSFDDVVHGIAEKMIRRHPHVFGSDEEREKFYPEGFWERIKQQEKSTESAPDESVLDGVPLALPALVRAIKLQNKAARVGFDWPDMEPVLAKIREEIEELEEATNLENPSREKIAEEYGDMLFVVANLGRHLQLEPEDALRSANAKFIRRFGQVEKLLKAKGKTPEQSDLAEMDALWDEVKAGEREDSS